jgi:lipopolysaccharide export system protein LptA
MIPLLIFICANVNAQNKAQDDKTIVINSESMIADKPTNQIIFQGKVVATRGDIKMNADKMVVNYATRGETQEIDKIHAIGNVKVVQKDKTILSNEAFYYKNEEKIEFLGNARADDGMNIINGSKIIYHTKDERVEVMNPEVFLKESGKNDAQSKNK